ncbi:unnamed protein product [Diabrotica balteata]|uniref:Cytochrome P450 n=1 Tax=Diabrotica balteata TaxID=107213 RepID=A0A9N9T8E8_DIABA|nr:unnamed protein product [Diabrotica balteata]
MLLTSSWIVDVFAFSAILSTLLYVYFTRNFNYWKKRNVFHRKPVPFFGNFKAVATMKSTIGEWLRDEYNRAAKQPYFGIFVFDEPKLVIKSPEIIKNIMIKDFSNFSDRTFAFPNHNEVESNFLFFMPNPKWKKHRSQLSPAFTSGKLKGMLPIIHEVGETLQKYLYKNQTVLEAKEVMAKYSTDVIGKCFLGINPHCFDNENALFRVLGRAMFDFSVKTALTQTAYFSTPGIVKFFKINFFDQWIIDHFTECFGKSYEAREKSKIRKNDFIDILRDMERKGAIDKDIGSIQGSSMQFFVAGFETTSSTTSFTLYELCLNKTIQNKLRSEILANIRENKGITYEGVMQMKYLDLCIKETLRKYPVLPFLDRRCLSNYTIPGTDLVIEKGSSVYIPMFGLHYDETYFPEPTKYNPERFEDTNYNTNGLVYFPFGEGPRICIGERFGLMSAKLALIYTLTKFEVEKCESTPDPLEFEPKSLVLQSKVGVPMRFKHLVPSPA